MTNTAAAPISERTILWFLTNDPKGLLRICKNETLSPASRKMVLGVTDVHAHRNTAVVFAHALMADSDPSVRAEAAALLSTLAPIGLLVSSLNHNYVERS